jgi:hypothetical protein
MSSFKVRYNGHNCAYLDEPALPDGSYVGDNKYSGTPVHLRWDDVSEEWIEVCVREFTMPDAYSGMWIEALPRVPCSCWAP